jgi:hypothetical protein
MSQYKAKLAEKSRLESLIRIEKIKGKHVSSTSNINA